MIEILFLFIIFFGPVIIGNIFVKFRTNEALIMYNIVLLVPFINWMFCVFLLFEAADIYEIDCKFRFIFTLDKESKFYKWLTKEKW